MQYAGVELQQQTQLMAAVREIIDGSPAYYTDQGQAFLDSAAAWQIPRTGQLSFWWPDAWWCAYQHPQTHPHVVLPTGFLQQ